MEPAEADQEIGLFLQLQQQGTHPAHWGSCSRAPNGPPAGCSGSERARARAELFIGLGRYWGQVQVQLAQSQLTLRPLPPPGCPRQPCLRLVGAHQPRGGRAAGDQPVEGGPTDGGRGRHLLDDAEGEVARAAAAHATPSSAAVPAGDHRDRGVAVGQAAGAVLTSTRSPARSAPPTCPCGCWYATTTSPRLPTCSTRCSTGWSGVHLPARISSTTQRRARTR